MKLKFKVSVIFLIFPFYLSLAAPTHAQGKSVDVTYSYQTVEGTATDGDILMASGSQLVRADSSSSNKMFGVLQQKALIVYRDVENKGQPVSRTGVAEVNVTDLNGPIYKGDYITSSELLGKGQKASLSGYVLGLALDDFTGQGAQTSQIANKQVKQGKIGVALRIEYTEINSARSLSRLWDYFNALLFRNLQDPNRFAQIIRYLAAGITVMIAFIISFLTFSRTISKGVEAIGRNPLARNAIQFSIIVNAALTTIIALVGVIASFIILRL